MFVVCSVDNGVTSVDDYQWYSTFTSVFTASSLQIPWYAILGNHDYKGNPGAQIEYTKKKIDDRWTMPGHLYSAIYYNADSNPTINNVDNPTVCCEADRGIDASHSKSVLGGAQSAHLEIVFIDTLIMAPAEDESTRLGGRAYVTANEADAYLASVEGVLAASTAKWLIVAGHYPVYSVADHGDTKYLIEKLAPVLRKYGVCAYFNGHDHVLQHLEHDGVSYFTSGHGTHVDNFPLGAYNARLTSPESFEGYRFSRNGPGFITAKAAEDVLEIDFIDKWGNIMYSATLKSPRLSALPLFDMPVSFSWIGSILLYVLSVSLVLFVLIVGIVVVKNRFTNVFCLDSVASTPPSQSRLYSFIEWPAYAYAYAAYSLDIELGRTQVAPPQVAPVVAAVSNLSVCSACWRAGGNYSLNAIFIGLMGCVLLIVYLYPLHD